MSKYIRMLLPLFLLLLLLCFCGPVRAAAEEGNPQDEPFDTGEAIDGMLEDSGAEELFSMLPNEGQEMLKDNGIDGVAQDALLGLSFGDLLKSGWNSVKNGMAAPLTMLVTAIGVILLCALLNSMRDSFQSASFDRVFSTVSVLCISAVIIGPTAELIRTSAKMIQTMSQFLTSFVPVYVGVVTASGKPVTAAAYSAGVMGVSQVISQVASTVLVPLLGIYLAICLIGGASKEIRVDSIAKTVQTVVITVLTFLLTVFTGLLSVQGVIAASADTVAMKTAKFAVGTFLPVVGGALSDALSTIQGCMGVVRSTLGSFGIVAIALSFLPAVISVLLMKLSLTIAGGVGEALGTDSVCALLRAASSALTLILGLLLVFAALFIVSVAVLLGLSAGAA